MAFNRVQQIKFKWDDANNNPASGWLVNTFEAGLAGDPVDTYSDNTGTLNDNPVVLDDRGEADIYLDSELAYKFIITNPTGGESQTQDNITGSGGVVSGGGGPEGAVGSIQYNFDGTNQKGFGNVASGVVKLNDDIGDVIADFSTPTEAKLSVKFDSGLVEIGAISGSSYIELGNVRLDSNGDVIASSFIGDGSQLTGLPLGDYVPYTGASSAVDLNTQTLTSGIVLSQGLRATGENRVLSWVYQTDPLATQNVSVIENAGLGACLAVNNTNLLNNSVPISFNGSGGAHTLQVGSDNADYSAKFYDGTLASIYTDKGLVSNGDITFAQASQAVISGASIAINTGTFRLTGDGISYDGATFVAPQLTANGAINGQSLGIGGNAQIDGTILADIYNTIDTDNVQQRMGVTKLTHADTLTTVTQDVEIVGNGTIGRQLFLNGSASAGDATIRLTEGTNYYGSFIKYEKNGNNLEIGTHSDFDSDYMNDNVAIRINRDSINVDFLGNVTTNGATNFGRLASAPTANASGDIYFQTTGTVIGWFWWNGTDWLQFAEGNKPFLDLYCNSGTQHIVTQANIDEDFLGWVSSGVDDTNQFSFNSNTGVYTYEGPSGLKFDGKLPFVGTANTANMNCALKLFVDSGSGFQEVIKSYYPVEFDGSNERSGAQFTTAILNNGDQIKVTIRSDKTGTITFGYMNKQIREFS